MKAAKQQSVGVEIGLNVLKLVALGSNKKPVYAQSFPWELTEGSWALALKSVLEKVFGKSQPKKVGITLSLRSQKTMLLKPSVQNPDLDAYVQWANELYSGVDQSALVCEYSAVENTSRPTINALTLRLEEMLELRENIQSTGLNPKIVDSTLLSLANAVNVLGVNAGDALVIKLEQGRSQWLALREGALQLWGDFSISMDLASELHWAKRLAEKIQELSAKWPSRPIYVSGELLMNTEVSALLASEFAELKLIDPLAGLLPSYESASYAAAWTMALRAGEEK